MAAKRSKKKNSKEVEAPEAPEESTAPKDLKSRIEKIVGEVGGIDPVYLLVCYANGFDPRPNRASRIFNCIKEIVEARGDSPPTVSQWKEVQEVCSQEMLQPSVTSEQSQSAAKELLQYQFPKLKATELTGKGFEDFGLRAAREVTKQEAKIFREVFSKEY